MARITVPEIQWSLEDFRVPTDVSLSTLRLNLDEVEASPRCINIALKDCFRRDGPRVGGVVMVSGESVANNIEILRNEPYSNYNCAIIDVSSGQGPSLREVLGELQRIALELGIRTKKGGAIDFSKIKPVTGTYGMVSNTESVHCDAYLENIQTKRILLARFRGAYGFGSRGADDAHFIRVTLDTLCATFDPDGIVVDFRSLDYEFGDDISIVTYKFHDADAPSFAVVRESQVPFFVGASIECYAISDREAMERVVDRINSWIPKSPVVFLKRKAP